MKRVWRAARPQVIVAATLGLFASACVDHPPGAAINDFGQPKQNVAKIVIYRPGGFVGSLVSPTVKMNGVDTCDIAKGGAFVHEVEPGPLTISVTVSLALGTSTRDMQVEAGKVYYVRVDDNKDKVFAGAFLGLLGEGIAEVASDEKGPYHIDPKTEADALAELGDHTVKLCNAEPKPTGIGTKAAAASPDQ